MTEHHEQVLLFRWMALYPELECAFAIPNGGHRHKAVAAKLKAEGVKRGVPDIFIPIPRDEYHGLFIEMKAKKGSLSDAQRCYRSILSGYGYRVDVCKGFEAAQEVIRGYMQWTK